MKRDQYSVKNLQNQDEVIENKNRLGQLKNTMILFCFMHNFKSYVKTNDKRKKTQSFIICGALKRKNSFLQC